TNKLSNSWRVKRMTAQNIHLVNPPPIAKVMVPSRRRLTPANTKDRTAADGANSSRTEMTNNRIHCTVVARTMGLAHAVANHLPATELHLLAIDRVILLHLD